MADITPLLAQLLARAQQQTLALTRPNSAPSATFLQVARLNDERQNRKFLQKEAADRVAQADAARIHAVNMKTEDAKRERASFGAGMQGGEFDPETMDPEKFAAGSRERRSRLDFQEKEELEDLKRQYGAVLYDFGGDPRPILADPAKVKGIDEKTLRDWKRLGAYLDREDRAKAAGADKAAKDDSLRSFLTDILGEEIPAGVDPKAAASALFRKRGQDQSEDRLKAMKDRWVEIDDRREKERAEAKDQKQKAKLISDLGSEIDDVAQQIRLGRDGYGNPTNKALDALLQQRYAKLLDDRRRAQQVVKYAPGEVPPVLGGPVKGTAPGGLGGGLNEDDSAPTPLAPGGLGPAPAAPQGPVPPSNESRIQELLKKGDARTLEEDKEFLELTGGR